MSTSLSGFVSGARARCGAAPLRRRVAVAACAPRPQAQQPRPQTLPPAARAARRRAAGVSRAGPIEDDSTFGKPAAPASVWSGFQARFRNEFLAEAAKPDAECDVALAALLLAGEDDAVATRTAVQLPVEAYMKRLDALVTDFEVGYSPRRDGGVASDAEVLAALDAFLYGACRYRVPTSWDERYSPYRTYLHNVLAQRVGVPAALAALHVSVLRRLQARGSAPAGAHVVLPPTGGAPYSRLAGTAVVPPAVTSAGILSATLDTLTRAFWAWEWQPQEASGFLRAAQAAAGGESGSGRVGTVLAGVVMQPSGRPFGDLERAQLAVERALALAGGQGVARRDLAVLQAHRKDRAGALANLRAYMESDAGRAAAAEAAVTAAAPPPPGVVASLAGADAAATAHAAAEQEALRMLLLHLERSQLEAQFNRGGAQ
jgi:hypothetical protein